MKNRLCIAFKLMEIYNNAIQAYKRISYMLIIKQ